MAASNGSTDLDGPGGRPPGWGRRWLAVASGVAVAAGSALVPAVGGTSTAAEAAVVATEGGAIDETATVAAASALAHRSGEQVEVGALRSGSREVYAQPDGSFTAVQHLRPVRTRRDGRWIPVDTTLRRRPDGSVAPVAASVDLAFSGGGDGPLVRMARAGRELSLSWPGRLPEPVLDGDSATYGDVLPGVDLVVRSDVDGFSHLLVVKTRQAARNPELAELRFALDTTAVEVRPDGSGGLLAVDTATGTPVFEALPAKMWDSAGAVRPLAGGPVTRGQVDAAAGPPQGSRVAEVAMSAGQDELVLTPDRGLLTGADTVFPVYIDPVTKTVRASAWAMVSSGYPRTSYYKFDGKSTEGVGFCDVSRDGRCVRDQRKRVFYRMPTGFLGGKTILQAEFVAMETHAFNCNEDRGVQLWHTKGFVSGSTWNSTDDNWKTHLRSRDVSYCSRTPVEFGSSKLNELIRRAAARGWNTVSFGLRASSESSMSWWKRFADDAFLRVRYNTPPPQPKLRNLSMSPGGGCAAPEDAHVVNRVPTLFAELHDPDLEDRNKLHAQFRVSWNGGDQQWTSVRIGPKTSGSIFQVRVPSWIPEDTRMHWRVRAWDGTDYSSWSSIGAPHGCYFFYDSTVPAAPEVSSTDYPESDPEDPDDPWFDGVGSYGTFTIDSDAPDATRYRYGVNSDPTAANQVTPDQPGSPVTVNVMPTHAGVNYLRVQAVDDAGNESAIDQYMFRVRAGRPARAHWSLDEATGSGAVTGRGKDLPADLRGGASLGAAGVDGTALSLDGVDGYAVTARPAIRTDRSFTVAAWVRPSALDTNRVAVSQDGAVDSGFKLGYVTGADQWGFWMCTADADCPQYVRALADPPAQTGVWTHLAGVYDAPAGQLRVYVDGELAGTAAHAAAWRAGGGLVIGQGLFRGTRTGSWAGDVDDVRVFDQVVPDADILALAEHQQTTATPNAVWALDEPPGSPQVTGTAAAFPAEVHNGATLGGDGVDGTALTLDGVDDHATTAGPVVRTDRSFAVSAWARVTATPSKSAVLVGQDGAVSAGFNLYHTAFDRWALAMYSRDATSPEIVRVVSDGAPALGEWTHLVGVYDAVAEEIRLYVNGVLADSTPYASSWHAGGALQIGRGIYNGDYANKYFPGDIDDLRVFDRVVSGEEVRDLFTQHPVVVGRWKLNEAGGSPVTTPDGSEWDRPATLGGDAVIGSASWVGTGALVLDGAGDYAATAGPVLDTGESFTVAGWTQTVGPPARDAAVFSQAGQVNSGFTVRYSPDAAGGAGGWQVDMPAQDQVGSTHRTADHSAFHTAFEWDHLAIVYDAFQDQLRLYVNGQLEQTEDRVSWRWHTTSFQATGGLQLGRTRTDGAWGEYWPGAIDDVWALQGIATAAQIQRLASGAELPTQTGP